MTHTESDWLHNINHIWRIFDRIMLQRLRSLFRVLNIQTLFFKSAFGTYLQQHRFESNRSKASQVTKSIHGWLLLSIASNHVDMHCTVILSNAINPMKITVIECFVGDFHVIQKPSGFLNIWYYCQFYGNYFELLGFQLFTRRFLCFWFTWFWVPHFWVSCIQNCLTFNCPLMKCTAIAVVTATATKYCRILNKQWKNCAICCCSLHYPVNQPKPEPKPCA